MKKVCMDAGNFSKESLDKRFSNLDDTKDPNKTVELLESGDETASTVILAESPAGEKEKNSVVILNQTTGEKEKNPSVVILNRP